MARALTDLVVDPGVDAADKILQDLEDCRWSPAEVARQARRLRAHITGQRARIAELEAQGLRQ